MLQDIGYAGRYHVKGGQVLHTVVSFYPNWVGAIQRRFVAFHQGRLVLTTPPIVYQDEAHVFPLMWERIPS